MPKPLRCDPKLFEKDLTGQVVIITGANSGIGLVTTKHLASQKATIVMACRSETKAKAAIEEIGLPDNTAFLPLDLSDLDSVRKFAESFQASYDRLDVLVANAGIMSCPYGETKEGFESQFGCNHLAHFLLFQLLAPMLIKTAEDTGKPSRFIAVSSVASDIVMVGKSKNKPAEIDFDDLMFKSRKYDSDVAYSQSKLANYLHAFEASKQYDASKLICVSLHPGWVRTNLDVHMIPTGFFGNLIRKIFLWSGQMIEPEDGAQTTLHCVLNKPEDMESGGWYSQFSGLYSKKECRSGGWPMTHPNANANPENASKLWEVSEKLVQA